MNSKAKRRAGRKRGASAPAASSRAHGVVKVLEDSVGHWSDYAKETAQLAASGNINPGKWAEKYAGLWKSLAGDVSKLSALAFPGESSRAARRARKRPAKKK